MIVLFCFFHILFFLFCCRPWRLFAEKRACPACQFASLLMTGSDYDRGGRWGPKCERPKTRALVFPNSRRLLFLVFFFFCVFTSNAGSGSLKRQQPDRIWMRFA